MARSGPGVSGTSRLPIPIEWCVHRIAPYYAVSRFGSSLAPLCCAKWDGVSGASAVLWAGARLQPLEQAPRCGGAPSRSLEHAPHCSYLLLQCAFPLPWGAVQCAFVQWAPLHSRCAALRCPAAMAVGRAPAWATGWGIRGHARGALQCGFLAVPCVAKRTGFVPWAAGHLDLFAGREKKVAGPGLEPTTLGSSTQHLNHSDTRARCFGGLHFHSSECAWRFLQLGAGGTRRSAAAARATSDLPKSKWGIAALEVVALGACSLPCVGFSTWGSWHYPSLHVGLCAVSLRLGVWWSPCSRLARPPGCRIPHRRRVVFSSVDGGFLLRSAAGWGFARRLELSPTRMEPSPRSVPLSACRALG
jgi:hypothetical protein